MNHIYHRDSLKQFCHKKENACFSFILNKFCDDAVFLSSKFTVGYSDFKVDNVSCIFGLGKYFQDYFRKGIFLYFEGFLPYFGLCVQKLEKWPF